MASLLLRELRTINPTQLRSHIPVIPRRPTNGLFSQVPIGINHIIASRRPLSTQKSTPNNPNQHQEVSNEMPKISWKDLGASRTVKIVVIIALSIIGTMETIFYFKMFMRKFFPEKGSEGEANVGSKTT
ncbi:hypothetical protein ABW20_dc0101000 [Dactylellina cionopaga]|nr:hypothetical protein ABW20_dc0101000 [Dactylellina cionopaga]